MAESLADPRVILGISLKLYLDVAESTAWARRVATITRRDPDVAAGRIVLFVLPSLPALPAVAAALHGTAVGVGAQDLHTEDRGAFTGAVSGADLAAVGCRYVEVGHAERRALFGEDDAVVQAKVAAAVRNGLIPVLCIGEEHRLVTTDAVRRCSAQLRDALAALPSESRTALVVAYEPMWAIGAASAAPSEHVAEVCAALRDVIREDPRIVQGSVVYGGSAQTGTLASLGTRVDGLFLGRFAHDTRSLARILDEARALLD